MLLGKSSIDGLVCVVVRLCVFLFFKQKTAYDMRISDWSSDVCSSDLFDQAEIDALAATIKDRGLLQPIVVAPTSNGRYIIRYGERRYRACRQLGFDQIDTVLDQADAERDIGLDQFLENEQRQALSLAERVSFIASRVSDTLSTKDLAARIAKPHSEVKRLYSLRTLPEDILAALKNCSPRAAVAIKHAIELDEKATRNFVV